MLSLAAQTRAILRAHGLAPRKALGQNFLIDGEALDSVLRIAAITHEDTVLEIGPGVGTLTLELASRAGRVVAVELDESLFEVLKPRLALHTNVELVHGNALHLDLRPWLPSTSSYKLVANIPYYITAPLLRHFLETESPPRLLVLMVQKEVAERLTAAPGKLSLLGVSAQFYARVSTARIVPASSFMPPPQVDSAIVKLEPYRQRPIDVDDPQRFFALVKAGFGEKRKQLHNALVRGLAHIPASEIDEALAQAQIERTRRAETLSLPEWGALYQILSERLPRRKE